MIMIFDGTFEGFLTAVFDVYYQKVNPVVIQKADEMQLTLDSEVHYVTTDIKQAARVFSGIKEKVSDTAASYVYHAFLSGEDEKYMDMLSYIKLGFKLGHMVDSHLKEDCVRRVHKLSKHVGREAHLLHGFARFAETKNGVLYCPISPKNDILHLVADHFVGRLMNEQWVIHDKSRNKAAVYNRSDYIITDVPKDANVQYAEGEEETQELWTAFFNALAIESRKNHKLQRQLLPLYFRKNMTEFLPPLQQDKPRNV